MKFPKLNQKGITHIMAPIAFIFVFAAVGGYVLTKSHAATVTTTISGITYITINKATNRAAKAHIQIYNNTTGAGGATLSDSNGTYLFNKVVPKDTYTLQAWKDVGCTAYYSSVVVKKPAGYASYVKLNMTTPKKLC